MIIAGFSPVRRALLAVSLSLLFIGSGAAVGSPAQLQPQAHRILVLGDSISAAYGMSLNQGWVALLQQRLQESQLDHSIINASISGETSGGGASRLPALLQQHQPAFVILELGGNDGLRGYPINKLRNNLERMITDSIKAGARVILVGMEIPPNYGSRYTNQFRQTYIELAQQYESPLVPEFLRSIGTRPELMQADGIHPTIEAQPLLMDQVWPVLEAVINE